MKAFNSTEIDSESLERAERALIELRRQYWQAQKEGLGTSGIKAQIQQARAEWREIVAEIRAFFNNGSEGQQQQQQKNT